jgi:hypothetical protein
MPTYRADFDVKSSIVLEEDDAPVCLVSKDGQFRIELRNVKPDENGFVPHLQATVIGPSSDIRSAATELRGALASHLDVLAYVVQANMQIEQCWRVVDWEPFQRTRATYMLHKHSTPTTRRYLTYQRSVWTQRTQ